MSLVNMMPTTSKIVKGSKMIKGVGTDIIEVNRIKAACDRSGFVERYFTQEEQALFHQRGRQELQVAGNFAVKESVAKVLGTGFREFRLKDIEVLRDELGKPYVNLYGNALKLAKSLRIEQMHVSISNTKEYVTAVAVGESFNQ